MTRRFLLLGINELFREMNVQPDERVLDVGCGTGRALLKLSRLQPAARLFGLDASADTLKKAEAKFSTCGKAEEISLRQGLAEEFSFRGTFGLDAPFDKIFVFYSLSMLPLWEEALRNALRNLKPGGDLYVLDFWDGEGFPHTVNSLRTWWLSLFKVHYRPEFLQFFKEMQAQGAGKYTVMSVGTNYAFTAHFRKSQVESEKVKAVYSFIEAV